MIEKTKLQDMDRIIEINKIVAALEDEIRNYKNEELQLWKKNEYSFSLNSNNIE